MHNSQENQPEVQNGMTVQNVLRIVRRSAKTLFLFCFLVGLVWFFSLEHNNEIDRFIQNTIFVIGVFTAIIVLLRFLSMSVGFYRIRKMLEKEDSDTTTQTIEKCKPLYKSFHKKKDHVVILLHGFVSSPMIFDGLIAELEENKIDYQAPLIYGFGVNRFSLLFMLTEDEWIRQITELYDVLDTQYDNISVVGHSLGALLASFLAQERPVKHLVLAAPAIFPARSQRVQSYFAKSTFWPKVLPWIFPLLPMVKRKDRIKTLDVLDDEAAVKYYLYPVAPTRGVFNILKLQARLDVSKMSYETLDLIYGNHDLTVDGMHIEKYFKENEVIHRLHRLDYTGHNPFIDKDRELVSWVVIYILQNELSWPPTVEE